MLRMAVVAAITLTTLVSSAYAPAFAFAGIDPCYKKCFMNAKGLSQGRKIACRRVCESTPRYQCEKRCWNANRDATVKANACITTRC